MSSETKKDAVTPLFLENYIHMVKASVGLALFRNLYCTVNDTRQDILRDGDLSCAFFVSWILAPFRLIKDIHATVSGTVKDLKESGWIRIDEPKLGAVIIWSPQITGSESHAHIGFYIGEGQAASNDYRTRTPQIHPWNSHPIEEILWHPRLDG